MAFKATFVFDIILLMDYLIRELDSGVIAGMGCNIRPPDPTEDKYRYSVLGGSQPDAADLSQARILASNTFDPRPPIFEQGRAQSCAACSSAKAVETVRNFLKNNNSSIESAKSINPGPLWYKARLAFGWYPRNYGTYLATNLDLLLDGAPLLTSSSVYKEDPAANYPEAVWDKSADYELSHQPFYPSEGKILEKIWIALNSGHPIVQGSYWPESWFTPKEGKIPDGETVFGQDGHAVYIWGICPGFVLAANSWGEKWSSDASKFGFYMRPGDFAIPWSYYTNSVSPIWELRAIVPELVNATEQPSQTISTKISFEARLKDSYNPNKIVLRPSSEVSELSNFAGKKVKVDLEIIN